jgi:hypothetical protein
MACHLSFTVYQQGSTLYTKTTLHNLPYIVSSEQSKMASHPTSMTDPGWNKVVKVGRRLRTVKLEDAKDVKEDGGGQQAWPTSFLSSSPPSLANSLDRSGPADDKTEHSLDDDEDKDHEPETVKTTRFDLLNFESDNSDQPIFTRELLHSIAQTTKSIQKRLSKPSSKRLTNLFASTQNGQIYRAWVVDPHDHHDDIRVEYLTRVEHHPAFQKQFGDYSDRLKQLRKYNTSVGNAYLPAAYFFTTYERRQRNVHINPALMQAWINKLAITKDLWRNSQSRKKLCCTIEAIARKSFRITRIVCIGLGKLDCRPSFYDSAIQHMAVFTIAETLNQLNRKADPKLPPIKIFLQDPNYDKQDQVLLKGLYDTGRGIGDSTSLEFVADPHGLLAIHSETIVITAYLPYTVPLVQILADLFSSTPKEGPVMMLCDSMELNCNKQHYCIRDRDAPHVVRWLEDKYEPRSEGISDHELEVSLMEDVYGEDWKQEGRRYWLSGMDLFLRKVDHSLGSVQE